MKTTKNSALEHLELLYKLNGIGKTASGDFVLAYDTGWAPCPPDEAAEDLAGNLGGIDAIREKICIAGDENTILPIPDLIVEGRTISFDDETEYGEPQAWIYLSNDTSVEITHEEHGLALKEQYFSARHHCSEEDFENDVYHSTMGVIDQRSGGLADIASFLDNLVKEANVKGQMEACPICGKLLPAEEFDRLKCTRLSCSCGCITDIYPDGTVNIRSDSVEVSAVFAHDSLSHRVEENAVFLSLFLADEECYDGPTCILDRKIPVDHQVAKEDFMKCAAAGYKAASQVHEKHSFSAIKADAVVLLDAALYGKTAEPTKTMRGDLISRCGLFNRLAVIPAPPEANDFKAEIYMAINAMEAAPTQSAGLDWNEIGPKAVFSLIATLYEKKLYQGLDDNSADREADEDVCEMTGLTLEQLGELYESAGLDSIRGL